MSQTKRNTWLFIGFLLLGGVLNLFTRSYNTLQDTFFNSLRNMVFIGLILFWLQSVRIRLITSLSRIYIIYTAVFMLLYQLIRIISYDIADTPVTKRYAIYAYWLPQMIIPALFLMTCIRICRGRYEKKKWNEILLLIPAVLIFVMAVTNDLHHFVYVPQIDISEFAVVTGTYLYGPGFYIFYVWMTFTLILGLIILFRETGKRPAKVIRSLIAVILIWIIFVLLNLFVIDRVSILQSYALFRIPQINIFAMLGIIEICIRYRLIPYNEKYYGFFRKLHMPSVITDLKFHTVFSTEMPLSATDRQLKDALVQPAALTSDLKLYGKEIRAGFAFWAEDESEVHRIQERLSEANILAEQEYSLIQAETQQKEKDAYIKTRYSIYHDIAHELYPCQKKIEQILNRAEPGTDGFKERIAFISVLNAYVKRKTNLLLLAVDKDAMNTNELFLAIQESSNYLTLAGLQANVWEFEEIQYPADLVIKLYDDFEMIAEQLICKASSLMVSWNEDCLCLAAQTDFFPDIDAGSLPIRMRKLEDIIYIYIFSGKPGFR